MGMETAHSPPSPSGKRGMEDGVRLHQMRPVESVKRSLSSPSSPPAKRAFTASAVDMSHDEVIMSTPNSLPALDAHLASERSTMSTATPSPASGLLTTCTFQLSEEDEVREWLGRPPRKGLYLFVRKLMDGKSEESVYPVHVFPRKSNYSSAEYQAVQQVFIDQQGKHYTAEGRSLSTLFGRELDHAAVNVEQMDVIEFSHGAFQSLHVFDKSVPYIGIEFGGRYTIKVSHPAAGFRVSLVQKLAKGNKELELVAIGKCVPVTVKRPRPMGGRAVKALMSPAEAAAAASASPADSAISSYGQYLHSSAAPSAPTAPGPLSFASAVTMSPMYLQQMQGPSGAAGFYPMYNPVMHHAAPHQMMQMGAGTAPAAYPHHAFGSLPMPSAASLPMGMMLGFSAAQSSFDMGQLAATQAQMGLVGMAPEMMSAMQMQRPMQQPMYMSPPMSAPHQMYPAMMPHLQSAATASQFAGVAAAAAAASQKGYRPTGTSALHYTH